MLTAVRRMGRVRAVKMLSGARARIAETMPSQRKSNSSDRVLKRLVTSACYVKGLGACWTKFTHWPLPRPEP
eukprot:331668-Prymnesium_polylepis.3